MGFRSIAGEKLCARRGSFGTEIETRTDAGHKTGIGATATGNDIFDQSSARLGSVALPKLATSDIRSG